jgi:hypothetical protein
MTHARGGAAVIGCVALIALIADATYVGEHWQHVATRLHYGLVGGVGLLVLVWFSSFYLGLSDPTGTDRDKARARTRRQKKYLGPTSLVGYIVAFGFGLTITFGVILGEFALLAIYFTVIAFREAINPQHAWQPRTHVAVEGASVTAPPGRLPHESSGSRTPE